MMGDNFIEKAARRFNHLIAIPPAWKSAPLPKARPQGIGLTYGGDCLPLRGHSVLFIVRN